MLNLKFADGLIPVIVQDARSREVLMMAYANEEAVRLTQESGFAHYYSRSRKKLWKKGEESGHFQKVVRILADCDEDCHGDAHRDTRGHRNLCADRHHDADAKPDPVGGS